MKNKTIKYKKYHNFNTNTKCSHSVNKQYCTKEPGIK